MLPNAEQLLEAYKFVAVNEPYVVVNMVGKEMTKNEILQNWEHYGDVPPGAAP